MSAQTEHSTEGADEIPSPEEIICPEIYYNIAHKDFYFQNARGGWFPLNETGLIRHLKSLGFFSKPVSNEFVSATDQKIIKIQREFDVSFAGALAGYPVGMTEMCGNRILVTKEATLIEPKKGEWPVLEKLLENLFNDSIHDQRPYVLGWLKIAVETLRDHEFRPGQALAIAGAGGSGKSLVQKLITEIFGGRAAKPYRYMSGGTQFNAELFGAEHLMIEDEVASTDIRRRLTFGTNIKGITVNEINSCHPKNQPAINLKPFWRLSITLNDNPENMLILPPMDENLADKIMLLKAFKKGMPMPSASRAERALFWKTLVDELPAFLFHLESEWQIPANLKCERYGIIHYHHPDLMEALEKLAPETRLLELIDQCIWLGCDKDPDRKTHVEYTAQELKNYLCNMESVQYDARKLLDWPTAAGAFLGRLADKRPDRVKDARTAKERLWRILAPAKK